VPDVTLIVFLFPRRVPRAVAEHFPHATSTGLSRQENGLDSDIESEFRRKA